jgi:hypothetical protein
MMGDWNLRNVVLFGGAVFADRRAAARGTAANIFPCNRVAGLAAGT